MRYFKDYLNPDWLAKLEKEFPVEDALLIDYSNFGRTAITNSAEGNKPTQPSKKPKLSSSKKEEKPHQGKTLLSYFKKVPKS